MKIKLAPTSVKIRLVLLAAALLMPGRERALSRSAIADHASDRHRGRSLQIRSDRIHAVDAPLVVVFSTPAAAEQPGCFRAPNRASRLDGRGTTNVAAEDPKPQPKSSAKDRSAQEKKGEEKKGDEQKDRSRYSHRSNHDPNGIGKFYMGREIARVMGFGINGTGAQWLERTSREQEEKLTLLVKSLKLQPGDVVADIGAGSGVISILMAEQVGDDGKILAVDVQQEMLDRLSDRLKQLGIRNVKPVKGAAKTTKLEEGSVDLALMVDVYHEFEYPYEMILSLSKAMKPGGRVVFVEYRKEDPDIPIKLVHKMTEDQVKKEIGQPEFGLKWKETIEVLPVQHIIIFQKAKPAE